MIVLTGLTIAPLLNFSKLVRTSICMFSFVSDSGLQDTVITDEVFSDTIPRYVSFQNIKKVPLMIERQTKIPKASSVPLHDSDDIKIKLSVSMGVLYVIY